MTELEELKAKLKSLNEEKKYDEIIKLLDDDTLNKFNDAWLISWKSDAFKSLKNNKQSLYYAEKAIKLNKNHWSGYFVRGNCLLDEGQYEKALKDFEIVNKKTPKVAGVIYSIGLANYYLSNYKKAIENYSEALKIKPDEGSTIYSLALTYEKAGNYKTAIEYFEKSIELDHRVNDSQTKIVSIQQRLDVTLQEEIEKDIEKIKSIVSVIRYTSLAGSEVKEVVHYSKLFVADKITSDRNSKLHYSNVIYMNDPQEGKIFIESLEDESIKTWFEKAAYKNNSTIFLGSFLPVNIDDNDGSSEDQLLMWRTYGKDENGIDAAGCSLVIDTDFFNTNGNQINHSIPKTFRAIKKAIENGTKYSDDNKNNLLYVQYIRGNKILKDDKNLLTNLIEYLKDEIKLLIVKNNTVVDEAAKIYINSKIFDALQELCHLFKSADYAFEKEVRIIKAEPLNSRNIEYYEKLNEVDIKYPKHFYIKSEKKILPFLRKIYLGPKVKDTSHWALHLDYSLRKEEKDLSELQILTDKVKRKVKLGKIEKDRLIELNNEYPGGKVAIDKLIKANTIEIIPSKCHFV